ncbi:MAG: class I SAM-dependent methyltransferase [Actinobacteria bacterium]|nr:class I SAM-dependent methyltransferase [Actinomycetota bacterium]
MAGVLSLGQDARWRRFMVSKVNAIPGSWVLDVATGTGQVAMELTRRLNVRVAGLDQSEPMLRRGAASVRAAGLDDRIAFVLGQAERLPFPDEAFDGVTFTYLLRYVDDPAATLEELARVLRPGGVLACLEFHVPEQPLWRAAWLAYTRLVVPAIGLGVSSAWYRTGRFLGPSISDLYRRYPLPEQVRMWQEAGLRRARTRVMSLGGGIVIWAMKGEGRG